MGKLRDILIAWGPLGIFVAALLDGAGVPSPGGTDALILLVTIARPDSWIQCGLLAVVGSLVGSVIFHAIVSKGGEKLLARKTSTPSGAKLKAWFERYGMASVFVCAMVPLPFMPLKVMAICACGLGVPRGRFLSVMAAARLPRYVAIAYLGAQLGGNANAWLRSHLWHMGGLAVGLIAGIFLLLKLSDKQSAAAR
jgi:membrane protein DedA with SNARE-associated domain